MRAPDLSPLRNAVEAAAIAAGAVVLGGANRLSNTACLALPCAAAQTQVIALDLAGVAVSAGSACSSGKVARSHVLDAMGLGALAGQAIRVSLPWNATMADVDAFTTPMAPWPAAWRGELPDVSEQAGLSRQPGDHALRSACGRGDAAVLHRAFRQPAQRRAPAVGLDAEEAVETARAQVAALIGAESREVVFTSALPNPTTSRSRAPPASPPARATPRRRVITLATEHKCVLESVADLAAEGFDPVMLPVRPDGLLDLDVLAQALAEPTLLVSVMAANNETGVLQDLPAIAAIVPPPGRCSTPMRRRQPARSRSMCRWGSTWSSLSAHKIYGPKGVGALYVRRRPRVRLAPLFSGGGQERGLRSGTLPAPLLVGFGEACRLAAAEMADEADRLLALRTQLLDGLPRRCRACA